MHEQSVCGDPSATMQSSVSALNSNMATIATIGSNGLNLNDETIRNNYISSVDSQVNKLLEAVKPKRTRGKSKSSQASQMAELREGRLDLTSPDSILVHTNLRSLLNRQTFLSLPLYYQYKLVQLLPKFDQVVTADGWIKPSSSALSNEFFAKSCQSWLERLSDSKLTIESLQRRKIDVEKERCKLDPFKVKYFEPIWGQTLESQSDVTSEYERIPKSKPKNTSQSEESVRRTKLYSIKKFRSYKRIKRFKKKFGLVLKGETKVVVQKVQLPSAVSDRRSDSSKQVSRSNSLNRAVLMKANASKAIPKIVIPAVTTTSDSEMSVTPSTSVIVSSSQLLNETQTQNSDKIVTQVIPISTEALPRLRTAVASTTEPQIGSMTITPSTSVIVSSSQLINDDQDVCQRNDKINCLNSKKSATKVMPINTEGLQRLKSGVVSGNPAMSPIVVTPSTSVIVSSSQMNETQDVSRSLKNNCLNTVKTSLTKVIPINTEALQRLKSGVSTTGSELNSLTVTPSTSVIVSSSQIMNASGTKLMPRIITPKSRTSHQTLYMPREVAVITGPPQQSQSNSEQKCRSGVEGNKSPAQPTPTILRLPCKLPTGLTILPINEVPVITTSHSTLPPQTTASQQSPNSSVLILPVSSSVENNLIGGQIQSSITMTNSSNLCGQTRLPSQITVIPIGVNSKSDSSHGGCTHLKPMVICKMCGAFCHDDCIGPSKLCVECLVR